MTSPEKDIWTKRLEWTDKLHLMIYRNEILIADFFEFYPFRKKAFFPNESSTKKYHILFASEAKYKLENFKYKIEEDLDKKSCHTENSDLSKSEIRKIIFEQTNILEKEKWISEFSTEHPDILNDIFLERFYKTINHFKNILKESSTFKKDNNNYFFRLNPFTVKTKILYSETVWIFYNKRKREFFIPDDYHYSFKDLFEFKIRKNKFVFSEESLGLPFKITRSLHKAFLFYKENPKKAYYQSKIDLIKQNLLEHFEKNINPKFSVPHPIEFEDLPKILKLSMNKTIFAHSDEKSKLYNKIEDALFYIISKDFSDTKSCPQYVLDEIFKKEILRRHIRQKYILLNFNRKLVQNPQKFFSECRSICKINQQTQNISSHDILKAKKYLKSISLDPNKFKNWAIARATLEAKGYTLL